VAAYLNGEFGETGIFVGVPAILGAGGVERVVDIELLPEEKVAFEKSVAAVRSLMKDVDKMI
jgi:malate dehydrogenase